MSLTAKRPKAPGADVAIITRAPIPRVNKNMLEMQNRRYFAPVGSWNRRSILWSKCRSTCTALLFSWHALPSAIGISGIARLFRQCI